jgi:NADH:ubiquinone oxidoreductase subunit 4 (subunit M)
VLDILFLHNILIGVLDILHICSKFLFLPFVAAILLLGLYPEPFFDTIHCSVLTILEK